MSTKSKPEVPQRYKLLVAKQVTVCFGFFCFFSTLCAITRLVTFSLPGFTAPQQLETLLITLLIRLFVFVRILHRFLSNIKTIAIYMKRIAPSLTSHL